MSDSPGQFPQTEERIEQFRQKTGFFLAPSLLFALWFLPVRGLSDAAHHLLAVLGAVVALWVTEAAPLPVTALLGPALCVLAGIGSAKEVFRNFADPIIFLFLGSFLLAEGMLHHGLNRRIAFQVLAWPVVGQSSTRLLAALVGGLLLFLLPVEFGRREFTLGWNEAKRIDWGTILLFGGGLALGDLMFSTGLARWLGEGLAGGLQAHSTLGLVSLFTAVAILLSETTSNTASATMVVPVAIAVAQAAGVDPTPPALAACLGASMGFMLPVSTPPNAIVYGSGCVPLLKMVKYGALLDLVGFLVIVPVTTWFVSWLMKT